MSYKLLAVGLFVGGALYASPVQITISLSGGTFDRGVTTSTVDTGGSFSMSSAACSGTGCVSFSNIASLNAFILSFTVPSGSSTGSGSSLSGTLAQSQGLNGLLFTGQSAFNQNSSITENLSTASVLGQPGAFTGTLALSWSGNASVQARAATGTLTLNGDVASAPEPASALLLSFPLVGLLASRRLRRSRKAN